MLRRLFTARRPAERIRGRIPDGQRVYAVGDIHGRLDLLDTLLGLIEADRAAHAPAAVTIVFLGDLVDRGPDSAGVVERLRVLTRDGWTPRFLMGNHEEVFLAAMAGDEKALRLFCRIGGRETMLSYGMSADAYETADYPGVAAALAALVPPEHRAFLERFDTMVTIGDYAFVHAGVRPGVPLADQRGTDLRWIRDPFLDHPEPLEKIIVHGHTILEEVAYRPHRIGIDTGAYQNGRLTALALEGDEDWLLQT
jgi:serine/threonine protein phosphatase 1